MAAKNQQLNPSVFLTGKPFSGDDKTLLNVKLSNSFIKCLRIRIVVFKYKNDHIEHGN